MEDRLLTLCYSLFEALVLDLLLLLGKLCQCMLMSFPRTYRRSFHDKHIYK
jgi:hypothetical protein